MCFVYCVGWSVGWLCVVKNPMMESGKEETSAIPTTRQQHAPTHHGHEALPLRARAVGIAVALDEPDVGLHGRAPVWFGLNGQVSRSVESSVGWGGVDGRRLIIPGKGDRPRNSNAHRRNIETKRSRRAQSINQPTSQSIKPINQSNTPNTYPLTCPAPRGGTPRCARPRSPS